MEPSTAIMQERGTPPQPRTLISPGGRRPTAPPSPRGAWPALLAAAVLSAGLLWTCYFPLSWGWFAWVALVPLLTLVRTTVRPWFVYLCAWEAGLVFFWPVLQWMRVADERMYATWAMLATYCSLYVPAAIFLVRRLDGRTFLPLCLTLPAVWIVLEFVRSFLMTGFAWYYLGHTQHAFLPIIQISDLGGAYTVSFLVASVNALLFDWLYLHEGFRRLFALREPAARAVPGLRRSRWIQTAVVVSVLAAALGYGGWRMGQSAFLPGPQLALLQGNLDQRLRNSAPSSLEAAQRIIAHYGELCRVAAAQQPRPDLIVWPETSFPAFWIETAPDIYNVVPDEWAERHVEARSYCREVAHDCCKTNLLLGLNTLELVDPAKKENRYNSALLVLADGKTGGRYDKVHRVPFGEYVPLREWLPFLDRFAPYDFDYSILKGNKLTRFALGKHRFGVLICFEDTDPELARQYGCAGEGEDEPAADFLINISNDGWFDGTSEHEEHLALCRFRAIEARRSVARAVNMGISALIDSNGRVLQPSPAGLGHSSLLWEVPPAAQQVPELATHEWGCFKKVQGVLMVSVPIDSRTSLYALWGDWFAYGCCGAVALGLLAAALRRKTTQLAA